MPTSSPRLLTSAPPELPGLIAASVWMNVSYAPSWAPGRLTAETIPSVTVRLNWNGLPTASTHSATRSLLRIAPGNRWQARRLDLDDREIGHGVDADEFRRHLAIVGQAHVNILDLGVALGSLKTWLLVRM